MAGDDVLFSMLNYEVTQFLYKCHRRNDERPFMTDVDVICNGGYIPVHSPILMAASEMLKNHIMEQSRSEKEHMVIHLLDYDIADVTPVIQCFYTGRCLVTRKNMSTVYQIFENLGVRTPNASIIPGLAKEEDLAQKCCIRRYLDCDDDDEFIDDEEILNEVENPDDVQIEPSPILDAPPPHVPESSPPPEETARAYHRHRSNTRPGSSRTFQAKAPPEPRKTQATKVLRGVVDERNRIDENNQKVIEDGAAAVSDQEEVVEENEPDNVEQENGLENCVDDDLPVAAIDDEGSHENVLENEEQNNNEPREDEEEDKRIKSRRKRKGGNRSSRGTKRSKKIASPPPTQSDNSDRDSLYTPAPEDREPSMDEAEDGSDLASELDDDDDIADDFIVSDSASLEYSPRATRLSDKSERRKKRESRNLRTTKGHNLRTRRPSTSKSNELVTRRLRQRRTSGSNKSHDAMEEESHDESDEPSNVPEREPPKSRKSRGKKGVNCPICDSNHANETFFEIHVKSICGKTLSKDCSLKEKECYTCKKIFSNMRFSEFVAHVQECRSKVVGNSSSSKKAKPNSVASDLHDQRIVDETTSSRQSQDSDSSSTSSSTSDDEEGGIDGEEMVTVQNSKSIVYVKMTKLSEAEYEYYLQKLLKLHEDGKRKTTEPGKSREKLKTTEPGNSLAQQKSLAKRKSPAQEQKSLGVTTTSHSRNGPLNEVDIANPVATANDEATSPNSLLDVLCGNDEPEQEEVRPTDPRPPTVTTPENDASLVEEAVLAKKWHDETRKCPQCKKQYTRHRDATKCLFEHGLKRCWICFQTCTDYKGEFLMHCKAHHSMGFHQGENAQCPICQKTVSWLKMEGHITSTHMKALENVDNNVRRPTPATTTNTSTTTQEALENADNIVRRPTPATTTSTSTTAQEAAEENEKRADDDDDDNEHPPLVRIKDFSEIMEPEDSSEGPLSRDLGDASQTNLNTNLIQARVPSITATASINNSRSTTTTGTGLNNGLTVTNFRGANQLNMGPLTSPPPGLINSYPPPNTLPAHVHPPTTAVVHPTVVAATSDQQRNAQNIADGIRNLVSSQRNRTIEPTTSTTGQVVHNIFGENVSSNNMRTLLVSSAAGARAPTPNSGQSIILSSGNAAVSRQPSPRSVTSSPNPTGIRQQQPEPRLLHVANPESAIARRPSGQQQLRPQPPPYTAGTVGNTTLYCGVTTINGVPFKVYQRPETIEPHPHAVLTVAGSVANGLPSSSPRLSIAYPQVSPAHHLYQNITYTDPIVRDGVSQQQINIVQQQQQQQLVVRRNSSGVIVCDKCDQQFSTEESYKDHYCLDVD